MYPVAPVTRIRGGIAAPLSSPALLSRTGGPLLAARTVSEVEGFFYLLS
jgi:hypothetical protein